MERPQQTGTKATARFLEVTGSLGSEPEWPSRSSVKERPVRGPQWWDISKEPAAGPTRGQVSLENPERSYDHISQARTWLLSPPHWAPTRSNSEAKDDQLGQKSGKRKQRPISRSADAIIWSSLWSWVIRWDWATLQQETDSSDVPCSLPPPESHVGCSLCPGHLVHLKAHL